MSKKKSIQISIKVWQILTSMKSRKIDGNLEDGIIDGLKELGEYPDDLTTDETNFIEDLPKLFDAFRKGKIIESVEIDCEDWEVATTPQWDFMNFRYRVKED